MYNSFNLSIDINKLNELILNWQYSANIKLNNISTMYKLKYSNEKVSILINK